MKDAILISRPSVSVFQVITGFLKVNSRLILQGLKFSLAELLGDAVAEPFLKKPGVSCTMYNQISFDEFCSFGHGLVFCRKTFVALGD